MGKITAVYFAMCTDECGQYAVYATCASLTGMRQLPLPWPPHVRFVLENSKYQNIEKKAATLWS